MRIRSRWAATLTFPLMACGTCLGDEPPSSQQSRALTFEAGDPPRSPQQRWTMAPLPDQADFLAAEAFDWSRGSRGEDAARVYRRNAEAVVRVQVGPGHGSGILLSPPSDGLVLTNYHVIKPFIDEPSVGLQVELGRRHDGIMKHAATSRADIVAWAPERDLALLKLEETEYGGVGAELAERVPDMGETLVTLGHATTGLRWAVRECDLMSVGTGRDLSQMPASCIGDASPPPEMEEVCNNRKRMFEGYSFEQDLRIFQSSCAIAHGDSGGPTFDATGALVGVNAFYRVRDDKINSLPKFSYFHVHLDEIREFLEQNRDALPKRDPSALPRTGALSRTANIPVFSTRDEVFHGFDITPPPDEGPSSFEALRPRLLLRWEADALSLEYDSDRDGTPETRLGWVVTAPGRTLARASWAERRVQGEWVPAPDLLGQKLFRTDLLAGAPPAFDVAIRRLLPDEFIQTESPSFPNPYRDVGGEITLKRDAGATLIAQAGSPAVGWLADLDDDTIDPALGPGVAYEAHRAERFDFELGFVHAGRQTWTFIDIDEAFGPEYVLFREGEGFGEARVAFSKTPRGWEVAAVPPSTCALDRLPEELRARAEQLARTYLKVTPCPKPSGAEASP